MREPGDIDVTTEAATDCPVGGVLERIGNKWSVLVLTRLESEPRRFRELLRLLPGLSQRMLTVTLRALERDGLAARRVLDTSPPGVEYSLTPLGRSLVTPTDALVRWALAHGAEIAAARRAYDGRAAQ